MLKNSKVLLLSNLFVMLSACSSQQLYEATQANRQLDCQSKPPAEKQLCLDNLNKKTYKEYQESRQSL